MRKVRHTAVCLLLTLASISWGDSPRRLPPIDASDTGAAIVPVVYEPLIGLAYEEGACPPCRPRYEVGAQFDRGIFIRGVDPQRDPYALYIGARLQLRHTGFTRDAETWTDSAGVTREIRYRNQFESERLRLNLSGTAIDPDLSY